MKKGSFLSILFILGLTLPSRAQWGHNAGGARFYWYVNGGTATTDTLRVIAGTGVSLVQSGKTLEISATGTGGDITAVTAGDGLKGGGVSGAVTVDVNPKLSGSGRLIVVSDSLKVNANSIDSSNVTPGTLASTDIR